MKHVLTITEVPDDPLPETFAHHAQVERLRVVLDEVTPTQLQDIMAILYRTPRKPRKDRGSVRGKKTGQDSGTPPQQTLPGT